MTQPWYTSKALWAAVVGFGMVVWYGLQTGQWDPKVVGAAVMLVLGAVFRWNADAPLGSGEEARRLAAAGTAAPRRRGLFSDRLF